MNKLLLISLLFWQPINVPDGKRNEAWWANYIACDVLNISDTNVAVEYQLPDGRRIDIFHDGTSWEVDWAKKYCEAIGQTLSYAIATNSNSGIILLFKTGDDEYYNAALSVITSLRNHGYNIRLLVVNVDNGKVWTYEH